MSGDIISRKTSRSIRFGQALLLGLSLFCSLDSLAAEEPVTTMDGLLKRPSQAGGPPTPANRDAEQYALDLKDVLAALKQRRFAMSVTAVDKMLERVPRDGELRQIKSLALFGQGDFQQAAAEAYNGLSLCGPMHWQAIRELYPSAEEYTQQYQLLARQCRDRREPHLHFLLGYHHLMLGHVPEARASLTVAQEALPKDPLIRFILSQLPTAPLPTPPNGPAADSTATNGPTASVPPSTETQLIPPPPSAK